MRLLRKLETWYQTDLDFNATKQKVLSAGYRGEIIGDWHDDRGRLSFSLKDYKSITYQVTTKGKLGVYHPKEIGIDKCLELVKPYLVKVDGSPAEMFSKIVESGDQFAKDLIGLNLLKQLEKEFGSELDLTPLRLRVESLNSLMRAGASISLYEADVTKEEIGKTVDLIEMHMNEEDPHLLNKCNCLEALEGHLRLVVDSLVKR